MATPLNTYGQPIDKAPGSPVPFVNPNMALQTPGTMGGAPTAPQEAPQSTPSPYVQPSSINRTVDTPANDPEAFLNTFTPPQTEEQIAEAKRRAAQGQIDAIQRGYDDEVAAARKTGDERLSMDNAVSVLSGLTGSTEAGRTRTNVLQANDKEIQAINNKRAMDLASVYSKISDDAHREAREQLQDATKSADAIVARRKEAQTQAISNITLMAKGGLVDFESFKNSPQNATVYKYALDSVDGSEDALRSLFIINRPHDQIIGTPTRIGNKYVQAYQNPITGKVAYESIDLPFDLPPEYSNFQKMGDNLVAIPKDWDGDTSKLVTIAGQPSTMERLQQQSLSLDIQKKRQDLAGGGSGGGGSAGTGKPPTQDQITAGLYATRLAQSNAVIQGLEGKIAGMSPASYAGQSYAEGNTLLHGFASEDIQKATQAERNFVNAVLRRESGAAIAQSEFDNAQKQYFPRPGDTPGVLAQKAENRQAAIDGLTKGAGPSFTPPAAGLKAAVTAKGYNYDQMKADGYTDEQIKAAIGL